MRILLLARAGDREHTRRQDPGLESGSERVEVASALDAGEILSVRHLAFELDVLLEDYHSALLRQAARTSTMSKLKNINAAEKTKCHA